MHDVTMLKDEFGQWHKASSADAITRETIEVSSFNVSEIQRVNISLHTLSTAAEEKITVKHTTKQVPSKAGDTVEYNPINCAKYLERTPCVKACVNTDAGAECCCCFFTPSNCLGNDTACTNGSGWCTWMCCWYGAWV
jgi:hypothetical protein